MILRPEPAVAAIEQAKAIDPEALVILTTPRGAPLNQGLVRSLVGKQRERNSGFIILCPRYEGVDERVAEHWVDYQISLGDYILMGGEAAALAFTEASARLIPGVLGNTESCGDESFEKPLLEYPQYTKPQSFRGFDVPKTLLSGNHQEIASWRQHARVKDTVERRSEIAANAQTPTCPVSVALIHHPVEDKQGKIITSSMTNLDLHDIARSAKTYGLERFYITHPIRAMRRLAERIEEHWATGYGLHYNPNRSEALECLSVMNDIDDVIIDIERRHGKMPKIVVTSARVGPESVTYQALRALMNNSDDPWLLLLGTGWGLAREIMSRAEYRLEPICGPTDYNHLSVRAAAAISFDRLFRANLFQS